MKALWFPLALLALALAGTPDVAMAQDDTEEEEESDDDSDLGAILGTSKSASETIKAETEAVRSGDLDDRVGVKSEVVLPDEGEEERKVIKTLQRKTFLKLARWEVAPHVGFVTSDPFIRRYLFGVSAAYHLTEVFALELSGTFSPDLGRGDWKPITDQLVTQNRVSPDISKIYAFGAASFQFSPIYGKVAVGNRIVLFDLFGVFGLGIVNTHDDLEALQAVDDIDAQATQSQVHATTNYGGGFRVVFSKSFAARIEGRSMSYIETIDSITLEMKNNFMLQLSASFFFPGIK